MLLLLMIFPVTVEHFMRHKSEALDKFMEFKAAAEKESGKCIKALRADRGGEYM